MGTRSEAAAGGAAEEFWRFSLTLYGAPGVSEACLALQDRHGLDVNLVLFCLWVGASRRGRLDDAGLATAEAAVAEWRDGIVVPLRRARRALKTAAPHGAADLYARVKEVELAAERIEQESLAALVSDRPLATPTPLADAAANLALYLRRRGVSDGIAQADEILASLASMKLS